MWYVTSVSGFMGWYGALFWEDYRCYCCSSQNKLIMKGEIFLWSVLKIDLKSLLKSALTGKNAFDVSSWSCPSFISSSFCLRMWIVNFRHSEEVCEIGAFVFAGVIFYFLFKSFFLVDKVFLSNVFELLQLSFGLSKHTWNWMVENDLMKWNRGILKKIKSFWYWMTNGFFACWLLIPEQIL